MRILSSVFVIVGIIIGAGFASGKEIYTFFYIYGDKGIIGIIISIAIIGCIIYKTLKIIKKYDIDTYDEFLEKIMLKKGIKNIDVKLVLNFIINIFLLITFFIMCAGFSAYFKQEFGINEIYSSMLIAIFSYIILNKNMKGIFYLNSILIPIIIIILIILGVKSLEGMGELKIVSNNNIWILRAILYVSYNTITLVSMLIPMKKYIQKKNDLLKISFFSVILIIILAIIIFSLLLNIDIDISKIELPAVYVANTFGNIYRTIIWNNNIRSYNNNSCFICIWFFKQYIKK